MTPQEHADCAAAMTAQERLSWGYWTHVFIDADGIVHAHHGPAFDCFIAPPVPCACCPICDVMNNPDCLPDDDETSEEGECPALSVVRGCRSSRRTTTSTA